MPSLALFAKLNFQPTENIFAMFFEILMIVLKTSNIQNNFDLKATTHFKLCKLQKIDIFKQKLKIMITSRLNLPSISI